MNVRFLLCRVALVSLLLVSAASCSINVNLARRYKNRTKDIYTFINPTDVPKYVTVEMDARSIVESPPKSEPNTLYGMAAEGQAEFIKAMSSRVPDVNELIAKLGSNISTQKESKIRIKIIPRSLKKKLYFKVERRMLPQVNYGEAKSSGKEKRLNESQLSGTGVPLANFNNQADRLSQLEIQYELVDSSLVAFTTWDQFSSKFITVNLGKASSAQQWAGAISANAGAGSTLVVSSTNSDEATSGAAANTTSSDKQTYTGREATTGLNQADQSSTKNTSGTGRTATGTATTGVSASANYSDKFETSVDLSNRILSFSGMLKDKKITIYQEGGPTLDLSGNNDVTVEYFVKADWAPPARAHKFAKLYDQATGKPLDPAALEKQADEMIILFPDVQDDIKANLRYRFLYRRVDKGNQHLPEARHKVRFLYGERGYQKGLDPGTETIAIGKKEFRPTLFTLSYQTPPSQKTSAPVPHVLQYKGEAMQFETMQEAAAMLEYLMTATRLGIRTTDFSFAGSGPAVNKETARMLLINKKQL